MPSQNKEVVKVLNALIASANLARSIQMDCGPNMALKADRVLDLLGEACTSLTSILGENKNV